jgi:hypothetical protein
MKRQANYDDLIYTCYSQFGVLDTITDYKDVGGFQSWQKLDVHSPDELMQEICTSGYTEQTFERHILGELLKSVTSQSRILIPLHRFMPSDLLGGLYLQTPFLLIEGLGILMNILKDSKFVLLFDPEEKEISTLLQDCLKQVKADAQLSGFLNLDSLTWCESSPHERFYASWEVRSFYQGDLCLSPLSLLAIPWIIRFGSGAYIQRFGPTKAYPLLISLLGKVHKPGLYEISSDVMLHDFIEMQGGGYSGGENDFVLFMNQCFSRTIHYEKVLSLDFRSELLAKYGFRLGLGVVECVSRKSQFRESFLKHLRQFKLNRRFKEHAEYLALSAFVSFLEQNEDRPKLDSDQYNIARELAVIVKPLLALKRISSCYLVGECIEHQVEHFIDDLLPEVQS